MKKLGAAALITCGLMGGAALLLGSRARGETAATAAAPFAGVKEAIAVLHPTAGHRASGTVVLRPHPDGVELEVTLEGLPPGTRHGFHVHEFGDCSAPDASSAGPHYDPTGMMAGQHHHGMKPLGDLSDLVAGPDGRVSIRFVARDLSLVDAHGILGRGLLLHESYDDPEDPMLASGERIACAAIGVRQPGGAPAR
jgi:Cu-Zn family superoxide dismutase